MYGKRNHQNVIEIYRMFKKDLTHYKNQFEKN